VRGHGEDSRNGRHAGAADAGEEHVFHGWAEAGRLKARGMPTHRSLADFAGPAARRLSRWTKLGQKPSEAGKIVLAGRLVDPTLAGRSCGPRRGSTDRQFDFTEQSASSLRQKTSGLMMTRQRGPGADGPRLDRRRFFRGANIWS